MCAAFTEDNAVFAIEPYYIASENFATCAAEHDTLFVFSDDAGTAMYFDNDAFARLPDHLWSLGTPSDDRVHGPFVSLLQNQGYFADAGAHVGVVLVDRPSSRRAYDRSFLPAMAAAGVEIAAEAIIPSASSLDEVSVAETHVQNAVLRFRAEGITRVVMPNVHGWTHADAFLRYAEQQGYRPRYGFNSSAGPQGADATSRTDLTAQLQGALYMGWKPYTDYMLDDPSPRTAMCSEWMREGGRPVQVAPAGGMYLAKCEFLLFLREGLGRATELTARGFRAGIETAGPFPGVDEFELHFAPGRHDGASSYQLLTYDFDCAAAQEGLDKRSCWRPQTDPIPLP
jgi:hypothetical protein